MSNITNNREELDLINEQKQDFHTEGDNIQGKVVPYMAKKEGEPRQEQIFAICKKRDVEEERVVAEIIHERKKLKDSVSVLEKLRAFFDNLQKQHPESHLDLHYIDSAWKVWCGVCKKYLRPDKSGKSLHNIQKQHFTTTKHLKNLNLMLQAELQVGQAAGLQIEQAEGQRDQQVKQIAEQEKNESQKAPAETKEKPSSEIKENQASTEIKENELPK